MGDKPVTGDGGRLEGFIWTYCVWEGIGSQPTPPIEGCDPPGKGGGSWELVPDPLEERLVKHQSY